MNKIPVSRSIFKTMDVVNKFNGIIFGMKISFGVEIVIFRSCLVCFYYKLFEIEIIMPLQSVDLYLWYGWLAMECR